MITTLDPQMREFICKLQWMNQFGFNKMIFSDSGGDVFVLVASGQEVKVSAVREAFQSIFGKATVM